MNIENFKDLYLCELSEASSFEDILRKGLPELAGKASSDRLREAITSHKSRAESQESKLDKLIEKHGHKRGEHTDQSMQKLIAEAHRMAGMVTEGALRDAAIIASIQRLKHYEIAVYGTLATYADRLGLDEDREILESILEHEKEFDQTLTEIAEETVNPQAAEIEQAM